MKIILDTNFLVYCAKQKIDYASELRMLVKGRYSLVVPDLVVSELKKLEKSAKKYSDRQGAKLALKLLKVNKVKIIKIEGKDADEAIIKEKKGNYVATVDLKLAKRVEKSIIIRGKRKLDFR